MDPLETQDQQENQVVAEQSDSTPAVPIQADDKTANTKEKNNKDKKKKKKNTGWIWPISAFFITLLLSALFSLASNYVVSVSDLVVVIVVIIVLIIISIIFDGIGVAFASCDPTPFYSLASKKIRGAKTSLALLKKADRVSSICNDLIGDICGIISGACGASVVIKLALQGSQTELIVSVVVGSLISALTVSGKAFAKRFALTHAAGVVGFVGKMLSVFSKNK